VKLNYLHLDNLNVSGFGSTGISVGGYNGASGYNDVRITNTIAHDNGNAGIATYGFPFNKSNPTYALTNVYVGHCQTYNNYGLTTNTSPTGSGIVLGGVNGGIIERSIAHDNGINNKNTSGPVGIWTYESTNVVIQNNGEL